MTPLPELRHSLLNTKNPHAVRLKYTILIFLVSFCFYALPLNQTPFFTRGEAREGLVIQAMFRQDNFILPLRNGADIPSKPPFFHWTAALLSYFLGGPSELSIRLPSALAASGAIAVFFFFCSLSLSFRSTLIGAICLGSSFEWLRSAGGARVDMMFASWVTLATFLLFELIEMYCRHLAHSDRKDTSGVSLSTLAFLTVATTCAILTKGPAGLVLPWAVATCYVITQLPFHKLPFRHVIASVVSSLSVAGIWYWLAYQQGGQTFIDVQLMRENVARMIGLDEYTIGHKSGFFSIFGLLFVSLLPWSLLLPLILNVLWNKRQELRDVRHLDNRHNKLIIYGALWIIFYLIFFGITSSKRNVYLLPCTPAYALLIACIVESQLEKSSSFRLYRLSCFCIRGFQILLALLSVIICRAVYSGVPTFITMLPIKERDLVAIQSLLSSLGEQPASVLCFSAGVILLTILGFHQKTFSNMLFQTAILTLFTSITISEMFLPRVAEFQSPIPFLNKEVLSRQASCRAEQDCPITQFRDDFYSANYYLFQDVKRVERQQLMTNAGFPFMLVAKSDLDAAKVEFPSLELLAESQSQNLYGKDSLLLVRIPESLGASGVLSGKVPAQEGNSLADVKQTN